MEFFRIKRDIPFMRHALVFNLVSLATFLAAVFFLFSRGLRSRLIWAWSATLWTSWVLSMCRYRILVPRATC